ncbi:MAG: hypothetical protein AAF479_15965 [Pseudomonadota bacterium]
MHALQTGLLYCLAAIMRLLGMGASTFPGDEDHDPESALDWRDKYLPTKDRQR